MQDWPERERYTAEDLLQIIRILRDRENGCPWDKVQTQDVYKRQPLPWPPGWPWRSCH